MTRDEALQFLKECVRDNSPWHKNPVLTQKTAVETVERAVIEQSDGELPNWLSRRVRECRKPKTLKFKYHELEQAAVKLGLAVHGLFEVLAEDDFIDIGETSQKELETAYNELAKLLPANDNVEEGNHEKEHS